MTISDQIFSSSLKLFMKYGVKSVSMDDIARGLGISKKTIYSLVENKKDLIYQVVVEHTAQEEKEVQQIVDQSSNALEAMIGIGKHIMTFFREMNPSLVYDLQKYHPKVWRHVEEQHFGFIEKTIYNNIETGQKAGFYRKDLHASIIAKLYIAQSRLMVDKEVFPLEEFPRHSLFEEFFFYHLYGVCTEKGRKYLNNKIDLK